ncbi:hypothetical protein OG883_29500 [Streptomyces sp. NBC_01142]|uniref:hypothetical protein n=1 Tax=Streptomyces sp. NBC_01142 TaxID=2975865 RepID=UPI002250F347|nr:hypothetical protein [Streptomyces sp. NBC_01142]MCX4823937.1 hypothetical protein [Streptomyces sp. NBC_01142]
MGIESDQLVYDYLSQVGDLAQQYQLPSGTRMRLVSTLRTEIDRQRAGFGGDSPAAVRRILGRIGTPDEVVAAASEDGDGALPKAPKPSQAAVPKPEPAALPLQRGRRRIPRPRRSAAPEQSGTPSNPGMPPGASPPHLAGMDELGPSGSEPDWWRIEPGPFGAGESVAGFQGGVEIPEILKPPPSKEELEEEDRQDAENPEDLEGPEGSYAHEEYENGEYANEEYGDGDGGGAAQAWAVPRRWRLRLRRGTEQQPERAGPGNPFLLFAATLLVAGALLGSWLALGGGWLLAYASRRLSRAEAKWAVAGLPGAAAAGGLLWLWGRINGRWGEPIPEEGMREALSGTWPWVVRGAAVASALYLVWRARRR